MPPSEETLLFPAEICVHSVSVDGDQCPGPLVVLFIEGKNI